jgi:hypothetical protein
MPGQKIFGLRLYQWGKESARGTIVAATSKIATDELKLEPTDVYDRPKLAKGLLHRNPGSEVVVGRGTTWAAVESILVPAQQQHWCSMGIKGGVAATGTGPFVWTFAKSLTADPAPDSWSVERRLTDGTTPVDEKWGYLLASELKWSYQIDRPILFSASGFARRVQAATLTAALAMPAINPAPSPLTQIWIDSTWATLGTTVVTAQVLKADITYHTGLKPKMSLDGRTDLDFTTYVFDAAACGIDVDLVIMAGAQYALEKTAAEAGTLRALRLKTTIGADVVQIDSLLKHEKASTFGVGQEDGQDTVPFKLVDSDDGTNMFQVITTNAIGTYV